MIGCASYNLCELRMCQICLVSGVPYLCIEVHMQTFIMLSACRAFCWKSLRISGLKVSLCKREKARANPSPIDS